MTAFGCPRCEKSRHIDRRDHDAMHQPPSHAARQRRYRRRQRCGDVVLTLTLSPREIDGLYQQGSLDLDALEDRGAIADAIHLLIGSIILDDDDHTRR
jgi:hypothetical protein